VGGEGWGGVGGGWGGGVVVWGGERKHHIRQTDSEISTQSGTMAKGKKKSHEKKPHCKATKKCQLHHKRPLMSKSKTQFKRGGGLFSPPFGNEKLKANRKGRRHESCRGKVGSLGQQTDSNQSKRKMPSEGRKFDVLFPFEVKGGGKSRHLSREEKGGGGRA